MLTVLLNESVMVKITGIWKKKNRISTRLKCVAIGKRSATAGKQRKKKGCQILPSTDYLKDTVRNADMHMVKPNFELWKDISDIKLKYVVPITKLDLVPMESGAHLYTMEKVLPIRTLYFATERRIEQKKEKVLKFILLLMPTLCLQVPSSLLVPLLLQAFSW